MNKNEILKRLMEINKEEQELLSLLKEVDSSDQRKIKIGETYSFGGYDWVAAEQCDEYVVLQSCGVTSGEWPGYAMSEFGNDNYYSNSIDGQDISDYDEKTKELYSIIKEAEYTSASYGKGLFLISTNKASSYYASDYYISALKNAAANRSSFGASGSDAWLGTVSVSNGAWYVCSGGHVHCNSYQNVSFVVAPAFNLSLSKIRLEGNQILINESN